MLRDRYQKLRSAEQGAKSDAVWNERLRRFGRFDQRVYAILKRAIKTGMSDESVEEHIRLAIDEEVRAEMMIYTDTIEVTARRTTYTRGWWRWKRTVRTYISVDVVFNPYVSHLSVWTDPKEPDGFVCFQ